LHFYDRLVIGILAVWGVVSSQAQQRPNSLLGTRWGNFWCLLPSYRYFAPVPVTCDYHLAWRSSQRGTVTEWLILREKSRPPWAFLFHPPMRLSHELMAITHDLLARASFEEAVNSCGYLVLLRHISALVLRDAEAVQFCVLRNSAYDEGLWEFLFCSEWHAQRQPDGLE